MKRGAGLETEVDWREVNNLLWRTVNILTVILARDLLMTTKVNVQIMVNLSTINLI